MWWLRVLQSGTHWLHTASKHPMTDDIQALQTIMAMRGLTVGGSVVMNTSGRDHHGWVGMIRSLDIADMTATIWTTALRNGTIYESSLPIDSLLPLSDESLFSTGYRGHPPAYDWLMEAMGTEPLRIQRD